MSGVNLSHSAVDKYLTCPRLYKLHHIDKVRSNRDKSPLLFGSAIDEALNVMLEKFEESNVKELATIEYNKHMSSWMHNYNVDFLAKDFDNPVLTEFDLQVIDQYQDEAQNHIYGWSCLYRKGLKFIEQYVEQVIPKIEEVIGVQEKIKKTNQHGDSITMYLDARIRWKCDDDTASFSSVSDHKTSTGSYSDSRTKTSKQLALYAWATGEEYQTYVVMRKDLSSKGSFRPIQIKHSEVNQDIINEVLEDFDRVLNNIKDGIFPKTDKKWQCTKMFGQPCIYNSICNFGLGVEDLDHLEVKK